MLTKKNFWRDFKLEDMTKVWHLLFPRMLSDEVMSEVLTEANELVCFLNKEFKGRIFFCLPCPRHIKACCGLQSHMMLDEGNQPISLIGYTNLFNEFVRAKLHLPERVEVIDYADMFGKDTFCDKFLTDGVHLSASALKMVANFFLGGLKRKPREVVKRRNITNSFSTFLASRGLIEAKLNPLTMETPKEPYEEAVNDLLHMANMD